MEKRKMLRAASFVCGLAVLISAVMLNWAAFLALLREARQWIQTWSGHQLLGTLIPALLLLFTGYLKYRVEMKEGFNFWAWVRRPLALWAVAMVVVFWAMPRYAPRFATRHLFMAALTAAGCAIFFTDRAYKTLGYAIRWLADSAAETRHTTAKGWRGALEDMVFFLDAVINPDPSKGKRQARAPAPVPVEKESSDHDDR